jgi:2-polyprenyl-3-methyl-5-hydroxy-6-metoxy-1,4-benzoquinol methylase
MRVVVIGESAGSAAGPFEEKHVNAALQARAEQWPGGLEDVRECPVCGDPRREGELDGLRDATFAAAVGAWSLKRCVGCQAAYLDPRPDPGSIHLAYRNYYTHAAMKAATRSVSAFLKHALANGYRNHLYGTKLKPALGVGALLTPLFPAIAQHLREEDRGIGRRAGLPGHLLDVGCGNGHFMQVARRLGWLSYGVDADAAAAAAATAARCGDIIGSQVHELGASYDRFFNVVTLSHVIEHVHDPVDTLRHCWRILQPGGYVWIETPNIASVGYEVFREHWRGLEAPRHLVLFSSTSLRSCLERAGFERIRILPPRNVAEHLFMLSAAMQSGRIAERDTSPLPMQVRQRVRQAVMKAEGIVRQDPTRSEFVTAVAYRPGNPLEHPRVSSVAG